MIKKKESIKRYLKFEGTDTVLEVSKVTAIKADIDYLFHIDRLKDGTVRITYNETVFKDLSQIKCMTIIRDDED